MVGRRFHGRQLAGILGLHNGSGGWHKYQRTDLGRYSWRPQPYRRNFLHSDDVPERNGGMGGVEQRLRYRCQIFLIR